MSIISWHFSRDAGLLWIIDVLTPFFHLCTFPHSTAGDCSILQIYIAYNSYSAFWFLQSTMATVWLRHPRYSLLVFVTLITTFYLLFVPREQQHVFTLQDNSLDTRVQRSHTIYDKLLVQRQGLIKKFGPTPKDIAL